MELADSLIARGHYDVADAARRYLSWWSQNGAAVWDCGPTAATIFRNCGGDPSALQSCASDYNRKVNGMSAGVNVCHRIAPLAMAHFIADDVLVKSAFEDASLTHAAPLAACASAVVALLTRYLIRGLSLSEAIKTLASNAMLNDARLACIRQVLETAPAPRAFLKKGGFCVDAFAAALYFTLSARNFAHGLTESISFAGADNYCPVICGVLLGATFGASAIPSGMFKSNRSHTDSQYVCLHRRISDATSHLSERWQPQLVEGQKCGGCVTISSTILAVPEFLQCSILSYLHSFALAGPIPAICLALALACKNKNLCAQSYARDLAKEGIQFLEEDCNWNAELRIFANKLAGKGPVYIAAIAAKEGRPNLIHWAGFRADMDDVDGNGYSALMLAAKNNKALTVHAAIAHCRLDQHCGQYGTALHIAAYYGASLAVNQLILAQADLEAFNGSFMQTPLHVACSRNHASVIQCLLEADADLSARDKDGLTPANVAMMMRSQDAQQALQEYWLRRLDT